MLPPFLYNLFLLKSTEKGNWKFVLFVLCSVLHIFLEVFLLVLKFK